MRKTSTTMSFNDKYLGCPVQVLELRAENDELNERVLKTINDTQELVMINDFTKEFNEQLLKKCLQDRISDVNSWRWVLQDLSQRIEDAIGPLKYEIKALQVVIQRVVKEVQEHCKGGSRPGALCPDTDAVEEAIKEEHAFLKRQKKFFEVLVQRVETQIESLLKTRERIQNDIILKSQAVAIDESCAAMNVKSVGSIDVRKKTKRGKPITRWCNRCANLKRDGLRALCSAVVTRQQVRVARMNLSVASESHAARVDSALRRRYHNNTVKYSELEWQKQETIKDLKALEDEQLTTEQTLIKNMEQQKLVHARKSDRALRPPGELIKDEVNRKIRDEIIRIKHFIKDLRGNLKSITFLQNKLTQSLTRIECTQEDLVRVIVLDQQRIQARLGQLQDVCLPEMANLQPVPITNYQPDFEQQPVTAVKCKESSTGSSRSSVNIEIPIDLELTSTKREFSPDQRDFAPDLKGNSLKQIEYASDCEEYSPPCTIADLPPEAFSDVQFTPEQKQVVRDPEGTQALETFSPPCTIADLPPEALNYALQTIMEEDEDAYIEESREKLNYAHGDVVGKTKDGAPCVEKYYDDDDGVDDYPFDY